MSERGDAGVPVRDYEEHDPEAATLMMHQERQKQDALLETLERSAELVAKKSDRIHRELRMQNQQIDDLHVEMRATTSRLELARDRVSTFIRRNGGWSSCGIVVCLSLVLLALVIIVIWGA